MADDVVYDDRMSDSDALMWHVERDPVLRSTIVGLWLLDQPPDPDRFADRIERATRMIPRLRQRVAVNPFSLAPPRWEVDPDFDLAFHVRRTRLPGTGSRRELLDHLQPIAMQGFDRDRPLWELHVIEGLAKERAALVIKLHHAISDGVGLVQMTGELVETWRTPDPARSVKPMPPLPEPHFVNLRERFLDALGREQRKQVGRALGVMESLRDGLPAAVRDPVGASRDLAEALGSVTRLLQPVSEPLSPILRGRSTRLYLATHEVPLADLRAAARKAGGRVNDAFVAGITGGLRRYHDHHGAPVDTLRMTMPINLREGSKGQQAGNQFVPARFEVPVGVLDPLERMQRIQALVQEQRHEPALPLVAEIASLLNRFPAAVSTQVFGSMLKGVDFVTTNVPGPPIEVYASGARVDGIYGFGPLSGSALNVALFSYHGGCGIGINCDLAAVADPERLRRCLVEGLDEVLAVA